MVKEITKTTGERVSPFERIKQTNDSNNEYWESRDLAEVLEYTQYRNFESVIEKAKLACFNSGHRIEDHFADVSKMVGIGSGATREIKITLLSRYACYLAIQNADPKKEIVAHGQTYFAVQTRRQELADENIEDNRRLLLREEMRRHNLQLADAAREAGVIEPMDYSICISCGLMADRDPHLELISVHCLSGYVYSFRMVVVFGSGSMSMDDVSIKKKGGKKKW